MEYTYSICFRTPQPLSQSAGAQFWASGDSFHTDGPSTYVFSGGVFCDSALSAVNRAVMLTAEIVVGDMPGGMDVLSLSAVAHVE